MEKIKVSVQGPMGTTVHTGCAVGQIYRCMPKDSVLKMKDHYEAVRAAVGIVYEDPTKHPTAGDAVTNLCLANDGAAFVDGKLMATEGSDYTQNRRKAILKEFVQRYPAVFEWVEPIQ